MSEIISLVSWDAFVDQEKIEGSDWVCPTGKLDALEAIHMLSGEEVKITDEEVMALADGRRQHLMLTESPEGYQAAKIIDSETGDELTDSRSDCRYAGIFKCNCGQIHGATVESVLSRPSNYIPLQAGKVLTGVHNFSDGTVSWIGPSQDRQDDDYIERLRTGLQIAPESRRLYLYTEGPVVALENARAKMSIRQEEGKAPSMEFTLWVSKHRENTGQIGLELDQFGMPTKVTLYKRGLLDTLGIRCGTDFTFDQYDRAMPETTEVETNVLASMAEALGLGEWTGFDLKMTAIGLYKAMGKRNLDPASVLVLN